ncbi:MAG: FAD-dependent thymidylate synthase [Clostridiales bacterium]|nr:FAD-dependent thymidylate synthase [Clostridiales bacterium]
METALKVELLQYTPEPEKLVSAAAKLCYSSSGIDTIMGNLSPDNVEKFIEMLMNLGHESPIEHVDFTFAAEGVSRALTHQLVRHRIGCSYSQQSQRYVSLKQFKYIIPPKIEHIPEAKQRFLQAMESDQKYYDELVGMLYKGNYEKLILEGIDQKKAKVQAEKISLEDARYVLPNACETKIMFTMNARALYNFFHLRCCNRAQWEIKNLADEMLRQVKKVAPLLFKNAGPSCFRGNCPEGKMSCGKMAEVRERYLNI